MSKIVLMNKTIDLDASPILYDCALTETTFQTDWEVRNAEWVCRDGALWGTNPKPGPGVIFTKRGFQGNVLVDCYAQTVLPSRHDIDVMWNMSWNYAKNQRDWAYVAGLQGWWTGNVGIEKSPTYKPIATAPCPWFEPGKEYHIQAGSIDGHCFIAVDDILRLEMVDSEPIDSRIHNRIGFEAYQSMVKISRVVVRQIVWKETAFPYPVEF